MTSELAELLDKLSGDDSVDKAVAVYLEAGMGPAFDLAMDVFAEQAQERTDGRLAATAITALMRVFVSFMASLTGSFSKSLEDRKALEAKLTFMFFKQLTSLRKGDGGE